MNTSASTASSKNYTFTKEDYDFYFRKAIEAKEDSIRSVLVSKKYFSDGDILKVFFDGENYLMMNHSTFMKIQKYFAETGMYWEPGFISISGIPILYNEETIKRIFYYVQARKRHPLARSD